MQSSLLTEVTGCMQELQQQKKGRAGQIVAHLPGKKAQVAATAEVQVQPLLHRMLCAGWVESQQSCTAGLCYLGMSCLRPLQELAGTVLSFDHNVRTTTGHYCSSSTCMYMLPGSCLSSEVCASLALPMPCFIQNSIFAATPRALLPIKWTWPILKSGRVYV